MIANSGSVSPGPRDFFYENSRGFRDTHFSNTAFSFVIFSQLFRTALFYSRARTCVLYKDSWTVSSQTSVLMLFIDLRRSWILKERMFSGGPSLLPTETRELLVSGHYSSLTFRPLNFYEVEKGKTSAGAIIVAQCPSTKEKIVPRNPYWLCYCPERPSGFIRVIWALKNKNFTIIK